MSDQSSTDDSKAQDASFSVTAALSPEPYVEPTTPNPFLIDDPDSDDDSDRPLASATLTVPVPAVPRTPGPISSALQSAFNINKDVPAPPPPDDDQDEEEAPEIYLPGLVLPNMFLPIPNVLPPLPTMIEPS